MAVTQKFIGDSNQLVKEYEKVLKANSDLVQGLTNSSKVSTDANVKQHQQIKEGIRLSQQLVNETETLSQKHVRLKESLRAAWENGNISSSQYAENLQQLEARYVGVNKGARAVAVSNAEAFGGGSLATLLRWGAGVVSIATAFSAARSAMNEFNEERNRGMQQTATLDESRSRLLQVSRGDFAQLESRADKAATTFGIDRSVARQVLFDARSSGYESDYEQVMALSPVMSPEAAGKISGKVRTLFGRENLTTTQAISTVMNAAETSDASIEDVTRALPIVGEGGRQINATLAESAAALATLSPVFKSTEGAAERLKMLASKMSLDKRTDDKGLVGGFLALQALPAKEREKFLGDSVELNSAYAAMEENIGMIQTRTSSNQTAQQTDLAATRLQEYYQNPLLKQSRLTKGSEIEREIAAEQSSLVQQQNKAYQDFLTGQASSGAAGYTGLNGWFMRMGASLDSWRGVNHSDQLFDSSSAKQDYQKQQAEKLGEISGYLEKTSTIPAGAQRNVNQERD